MHKQKQNIQLQLAARIRKLREKCGYTQEKLAELSKVDYKYLQRIEGKTPPSIKVDTLERIATALKVPVSDLFNE